VDLRVWRAPWSPEPIVAEVEIPGSKSVSNRALVLAAIADGPSTLRGLLYARDTVLMTDALTAMGAEIRTDDGATRIEPHALAGPADISCGLAGNVMRFAPAIAGLADGRIAFDGDPRARERPLGALLAALRELGVAVEPDVQALPFAVDGTGAVRGGQVTIDASASSQFVSALLLAGARYEQGVEIMHRGGPVPSRPHIDMTIEMLRARGVDAAQAAPERWVVRPGAVQALDEVIEPDLSNAAPFLAAAAVTGGTVTVRNWPERTEQPGADFPDILRQFGATVERTTDTLSVSGTGELAGIDIDLHDHGELTPVVAAVAALATSPTSIRGVAHLRGHETDRLAALTHELAMLGCDVRETDDGLQIDSRAVQPGGLFGTYHDHRMAHAGAVIGLGVHDLLVDDVETTSKTFPDFAGFWTSFVTPAG
jgi:3-phosphoshikimate 1-carboxyvinyltransferase